ncbi:MAG: RrF2 family transcriptional regulator [Pseudomonadota bacterium]
MLRLSKKLLFAVEAVLDIAYNSGGRPVPAAAITRRQGIPRRYLEPALQALVRSGILAGQRGPKGGYRLSRERRRISLGDIARVVGALDAASDPIIEAPGSPLGQRVVRPLWLELQSDLAGRLDAVNVEELCRRAQASNLKPAVEHGLDFTI